ncbi:manganese and iron superoxide dismutase [Aspergillus heteromorphus CBS 117.55]|uniref:Manganese and iron superoxide dismutase n=1 Tax=Aspergillus heteromorphus CBS 117.55 TaxID=1448321 RepID=A0A317WXZ5_9EURO|nr:manganese and iron superoxide dismutase [Aspergillus heteromorphus CBS 117.55]PWY91243.1 manganese and iron superoxide dismutase [Aspergillus heteromorphus CBS 117.55]
MLNRLFRPQAALRAASAFSQKPVSALPRLQIRSLHRVPQLTNDQHFKTNGVPEFLSPEAFDFAWTQYQTLLIDKLNLMTQDTVDADAKPGELLVKYSRRAEMASVFNYASMAHNNHFFFNCLVSWHPLAGLAPQSPNTTQIPEKFAKDIVDTCSSVESLKLDFLATANAMFGPGFVWLAKNLEKDGLMHIFCTYNAGSPYPAAHSRRQPVDMATHSPDAPMGNQYAGAMGAHSPNQKNMAAGALDVQPILCVNTWEHVWMMDYGIGGKAEYLERWWDRINWDVVFDNYNAVSSARAGRSMNWNRNMNMM